LLDYERFRTQEATPQPEKYREGSRGEERAREVILEAAPGVVALGYRLRRAEWGRGYATERARALIRTGFTEPGVERVVATTHAENFASRRVLEKAGMTLARTFRLTAADLLAADTNRFGSPDLFDGDDVEYALDRRDWERQDKADAWEAAHRSTVDSQTLLHPFSLPSRPRPL